MPATSGSPSRTTANVTAKSGAIPTVADVRDGPASRIATREEDLRDTRGQDPRDRERPHGGHVPVADDRGRHERDAERRCDREEGADERVVAAGERGPQRDRHPAEERGREEGEADGVHQAAPGRRASRRSVAAAAGSASTIPASITPQPSQPTTAEALRQEQHAEQRRKRRLEREHERRPRGRGAGLHPRRDEVAERPREHPGDDEGEPDRAAVRHRELPAGERDRGEADAGHAHLQERERARVVAGGKPLHGHDLERLRHGIPEHERVAESRPARHAVQQQEPATASATPAHAAAATGVRKSASAITGVRTTYSPVMKPVLVTVVSSSPAVCRP